MKFQSHIFLFAAGLIQLSFSAPAATLYVNLANNPNAMAPYATWSTAAATIQDAVNAANAGDTVLVTNSVASDVPSEALAVYDFGGLAVDGISNRVAITKPILVQSVNGPSVTAIFGSSDYTSIRCVYMTNGAILSGFTISNGYVANASSSSETNGGGIWCESTNCIITNCIITGCNVGFNAMGSGVSSGTLYNCIISNNPPIAIAPVAYGGGGAYHSILYNCTLINNGANNLGGGVYLSSTHHCTFIGNDAAIGGGAYEADLDDCVISNNFANLGGGVGNCSLTNCLLIGNEADYGAASFESTIAGSLILSNTAQYCGGICGGILTNCTIAENSAYSGGAVYGGYVYDVISLKITTNSPYCPTYLIDCVISNNYATNDGGGVCVSHVGPILYDSLYTNCILTNCILVGNHARAAGGAAFYSLLYNCLITNNLSIDGGGTEGGFLVNCSLENNTSSKGGGADGSSSGCILTNCLLTGNAAYVGGGASENINLFNCVIINNYATNYGGGVYGDNLMNLYNCLIISNTAPSGGGSVDSALYNCTVINNAATNAAGVWGGTAQNSIIYHNQNDNYSYASISGVPFSKIILDYCCVFPAPTNGVGNITNDPDFLNLAAGDLHLQSDSPCINSGDNLYVSVTNDFDGNPRISGGTVDMGAYEYQNPSSVLSYAWAQQYSLPTDGSADYLDLDGTGMNDLQKSIAGLNPTNPASVLAMNAPANTNNSDGITVTWQSVTNRYYFLQSSTNLAGSPAFVTIQSNLLGQAGTTSYNDASATNAVPYFYRIGVQ